MVHETVKTALPFTRSESVMMIDLLPVAFADAFHVASATVSLEVRVQRNTDSFASATSTPERISTADSVAFTNPAGKSEPSPVKIASVGADRSWSISYVAVTVSPLSVAVHVTTFPLNARSLTGNVTDNPVDVTLVPFRSHAGVRP